MRSVRPQCVTTPPHAFRSERAQGRLSGLRDLQLNRQQSQGRRPCSGTEQGDNQSVSQYGLQSQNNRGDWKTRAYFEDFHRGNSRSGTEKVRSRACIGRSSLSSRRSIRGRHLRSSLRRVSRCPIEFNQRCGRCQELHTAHSRHRSIAAICHTSARPACKGSPEVTAVRSAQVETTARLLVIRSEHCNRQRATTVNYPNGNNCAQYPRQALQPAACGTGACSTHVAVEL